jgi:RyR domain
MTSSKGEKMPTDSIAQVCHAANRAYCQSLGDHSQPDWEHAPDWQKSSAIAGVEFHLRTLHSGSQPVPSASHENWLKQKTAEGWKYGPVKDAAQKEHPCFVPYDQLPAEQKVKDYIFGAIVGAFYRAEAETVQRRLLEVIDSSYLGGE